MLYEYGFIMITASHSTLRWRGASVCLSRKAQHIILTALGFELTSVCFCNSNTVPQHHVYPLNCRGVARLFKMRERQGGLRGEQGGWLAGLKMAALHSHTPLYKVLFHLGEERGQSFYWGSSCPCPPGYATAKLYPTVRMGVTSCRISTYTPAFWLDLFTYALLSPWTENHMCISTRPDKKYVWHHVHSQSGMKCVRYYSTMSLGVTTGYILPIDYSVLLPWIQTLLS